MVGRGNEMLGPLSTAVPITAMHLGPSNHPENISADSAE